MGAEIPVAENLDIAAIDAGGRVLELHPRRHLEVGDGACTGYRNGQGLNKAHQRAGLAADGAIHIAVEALVIGVVCGWREIIVLQIIGNRRTGTVQAGQRAGGRIVGGDLGAGKIGKAAGQKRAARV